MKDPQIERIYTLTMEVEDLKRVAEEQRVKYERRIQKLRNKLKVVRAESSLQIYGLQEEIKAIAPTVSTSTEEFLEELLQKKNQVIKDLSIQVLELNDRLLNPQGQ
ncbi:hypothetical protein BC830DRAFT_1162883 [Chytriomyces sp. MP71]|nr:hypothetical protein BC830DRAFT_1162883 [Chytriomyces sp. MP71]